MKPATSFPIRLGHWALMRVPALLTRFALAKVISDADALAVTGLLQPRIIPFGVLPCGGGRLVHS